MKPFLLSWQFWAVLSAIFAALTAIFAKVGIQNINSDFATFIRTIVIIAVLGGILTLTKEWQPLGSITTKTWVFLTLSGLATGASWLCYFRALQLGDASQVAPIDKLSVVLVALFGALFLGESLLPIGWMGVVLIALGSFLVACKTHIEQFLRRRASVAIAAREHHAESQLTESSLLCLGMWPSPRKTFPAPLHAPRLIWRGRLAALHPSRAHHQYGWRVR